jgi:peptidylprolyl isomerase
MKPETGKMKIRRQILLLSSTLLLALGSVACDEALPEGACTQLQGDFDPALGIDVAEMTGTASGLCYRDLTEGTGPTPVAFDKIISQNTLWISNGTAVSTGAEEFPFIFNSGEAIEGIEEAVAGMRAGGKRQVIIPPDLAHGDDGAEGIPPGAILVAEIELVKFSRCGVTNSEIDPVLGIDVANFTPTGTGLCIYDELVGNGAEAIPGEIVNVRTQGWLIDGVEFQPQVLLPPFEVDADTKIDGFDEGVIGMRVGGLRTIIIPPELGYGEDGSPPNVPGDATLIFDLELEPIDP